MFNSKKDFWYYIISYEVLFVIFPIVAELGHASAVHMPFNEFDLILVLWCTLGMNLIGMIILLFQFIKRFNEIQNRKNR